MTKEKEHVYAETEIGAKLAEFGLVNWYYEEGWIRRKYTTPNWPVTLCLVNAIGFIAEAADHHPDLAVTYAKLWVKLQTHSAGGITDKDFALARRIEDIALWTPVEGGPFKGPPEKWIKG